jgi:hypothetical protein
MMMFARIKGLFCWAAVGILFALLIYVVMRIT